MEEFELIRVFFRQADFARAGGQIARAIGDDCALLDLAAGQQLAISTDSLVDGVHFPHNPDPFLLGQRALAVAVSDLAAMGASPLAFTLALSLPHSDSHWLQQFALGLRATALECAITLVGGDTTKGQLNIGITVLGTVPSGQALLRSGAVPGQQLWVSGPLGAAAAALPLLDGSRQSDAATRDALLQSYWTPQPQLQLGRWLLGKAGAVQDISDGLLADAGHIAAESAVQLVIEQPLVPVCPYAMQFDAALATSRALSGGDDYQLLFSLPSEYAAGLQEQFPAARRIGEVRTGSSVLLLDAQGCEQSFGKAGYRHFE